MREIQASAITAAVSSMCIEANCVLPGDVCRHISYCHERESWEPAKNILGRIVENFEIAKREGVPICQDTGMAFVFVEIGQDVRVVGDLGKAINEGVRQGYTEGFLRFSVVDDPLRRQNTNDNTPAMVYYDIVPGDGFKITIMPKGFGAENMSQLFMMPPSVGWEGVKTFVVRAVERAGANPCPPIVVGVGIGGTFDKVALLAKKALLRQVDDVHPDPYYSALEDELLEEINELGIGPQGFGGQTTALAVKIETMGTHIAGLPVAVNINCHVVRHISKEL